MTVESQPRRKAGNNMARQRRDRTAPTLGVGARGRKQAAHMRDSAVRIQEPEPLRPEVRTGAVPADSAEELFAPHEWDALVSGLEHESVPPALPVAQKKAAKGSLSADDLWERLAKTGWVQKGGGEGGAESESRRAQRPSA